MTGKEMERVGEYVLGLLDDADRSAFEAEMARDPKLAATVQRLQAQFQSLDDTSTALPNNPEMWRRIEQQLDASPSAAVTFPSGKAPPDRAWTPLAMAASVLVALGLGYLAGDLTGSRQPIMIAVLIDETSASPGAIVEAFADDSLRLVPLEQFNVPDGKILQVWTLPDPDIGPISLGTFADPTTIELKGPDLPTPSAGQLYEITLEPAPGSPTGRPTGPVLVKGFAKPPV